VNIVQLSHTFWQVILGMILGIFIALLYANRARFQHHDNSRINQNRYNIMGGIKTALDRYQLELGSYPANFKDLIQQPSGATNWGGPYLDQLPIDRWGHNYIYEFPGKHNTNSYDLMSPGPDGKKGTEDDIGNWTTK
jgi:general secretion pathway protein G